MCTPFLVLLKFVVMITHFRIFHRRKSSKLILRFPQGDKMKTRIQELRKSKKMSQVKLATLVDTSQNTISRIELEEADPSPELLCKLADYFHTSVDYILYRSNQRYIWEAHDNTADSRISMYARKLQSLNEEKRNAIYTLINIMSDTEEQGW